MKDYYAILGLTDRAHSSEIKRAYRRLAVQYHPDKNPSPEAAAIIVEINEAYDVLSDPQQKYFYDLRRQNPFSENIIDAKPKHRDPRYRPKPRGPREKSHQLILMEKLNRPARLLNIIGLAFVVLFALDYLLPYETTREVMTNGQQIYESRRGAPYYVTTQSGKTVKVYRKLTGFDEQFVLTQTRFFQIPMMITDASSLEQIRMGYMYRGYIVFPLFLLVASVVGVINRRNVVITFNFAVGTGLMLIINYFLVF